MNKVRVMLICGSGASSGFMAANMRKEIKRLGIDMSVVARSESELENYVDDIEVVMIGPHLEYKLEEVNEIVEGTEIKVILMKPGYYSVLSGELAIKHLLEEIEN